MMTRTFDSTPRVSIAEVVVVPGSYRAIKLPYRGSNISAIAVLPDEARYGLNADAALAGIGLEKLLAPNAWRRLNDELRVMLPKFRVKVDMLPLSKVRVNDWRPARKRIEEN